MRVIRAGNVDPAWKRIHEHIPVDAIRVLNRQFCTLPRQLVGAGELFVLRVCGDSLAGEGNILDGDLVVVRAQRTAEQGEVVAAMLEGEATVKRLERDGPNTWLTSDNKGYAPIFGCWSSRAA